MHKTWSRIRWIRIRQLEKTFLKEILSIKHFINFVFFKYITVENSSNNFVCSFDDRREKREKKMLKNFKWEFCSNWLDHRQGSLVQRAIDEFDSIDRIPICFALTKTKTKKKKNTISSFLFLIVDRVRIISILLYFSPSLVIIIAFFPIAFVSIVRHLDVLVRLTFEFRDFLFLDRVYLQEFFLPFDLSTSIEFVYWKFDWIRSYNKTFYSLTYTFLVLLVENTDKSCIEYVHDSIVVVASLVFVYNCANVDLQFQTSSSFYKAHRVDWLLVD